MECDLIFLFKAFMENQVEINDVVREELAEQYNVNDALHDHIDDIYEELSDQDDINCNVASILSLMTERINDLENRLNKLEKEKRRNASNK